MQLLSNFRDARARGLAYPTAMSQSTARIPNRSACLAAITQRDRGADGNFVYGVTSTGIYCHPSCRSRQPRPANIALFATPAEAAAAGFRPCLRCQPDQPAGQHTALIRRACEQIAGSESPPPLAALAQSAQLSRHHFLRLFKRITGLTPKAYASAHRARRAAEQLASAPSITDAIYAAGYNSPSRFYEHSNARLGMTPSQFRNGGHGTMIRFTIGQCSLGAILVAASARGVCAIALGSSPDELAADLQSRFPQAEFIAGDVAFEQLVARAVELVETPSQSCDLPLDIIGTAFQQRVWQALRAIPPGSTLSYEDIARSLGQPQSARAVARACASNPIAVAIPCHRVVRKDGGLAGYRWGVERKQQLLARERDALADSGSDLGGLGRGIESGRDRIP